MFDYKKWQEGSGIKQERGETPRAAELLYLDLQRGKDINLENLGDWMKSQAYPVDHACRMFLDDLLEAYHPSQVIREAGDS